MQLNQRTPFAPQFNFVVKQPFTFKGREYTRGDEFDKAEADERLLHQLWDAHKLDAVIPSIIIQDAASKVAAPKAKPPKKAKAEAPEAPDEPAPQPNRYRLEGNFGVIKIMDGTTVVRECSTREEAMAAMAELAGE